MFSFAAVAEELHRRFVADFQRLPVRVRARRVTRWVKARVCGLLRLARRPVRRVRLPRRPVLRLPRLTPAPVALLPRPGPARLPAKLCGP